MSEPITIDDIYKLFQNSQEQADRRAAEAALLAAEREKSLAKLERTIVVFGLA
jgi:hypothetical protein